MGNHSSKPNEPSLAKPLPSPAAHPVVSNPAQDIVVRSVSDEAIRSLVDSFIQNQDINNGLIPDAIERRIYFNSIKMILNMVDETLKTTEFQLLGHRLKIVMEPL